MIYEGAIIRRLVTPNHPGDPALDDPTTEVQFRVEYVKADPGLPIADCRSQIGWTKDFAEALRYRRHLDADRRAQEIGGMAHARVTTRDGVEPFSNLSGRQEIGLPNSGRASRSICPGLQSGGDVPPAQNNLPAEGSSSARAVEQLPIVGNDHGASGRIQSTSTRKARAAGKAFSKADRSEPDRQRRKTEGGADRMQALRDSARRTEHEAPEPWWREGQYA